MTRADRRDRALARPTAEPEQEVKGSDLERAFDTYCFQNAPEIAGLYHTEYVFDAKGRRKWRLDKAFVRYKVAVELHGGTWTHGRHTRGAGFRDDRIKMNRAVELGWAVIEVTTDMLHSDPTALFTQLRTILRQRGADV
jgi:hypothetical protein